MTYVFVNIKTTEIDVRNGGILSITAVRGSEQRVWRFNPALEIDDDYMEGLLKMSAAEIKSLPTFNKVAKEIFEFIAPYTFVGFDCYRVGVPMLVESFLSCEIDWTGWAYAIDAGELFKLHSPRTLEAAVTAYCGRTHEQLHDALADTIAIRDVFMRQVELHKLEGQKIKDISRQQRRPADPFCNFLYDQNGEVRFAGGIYAGELVTDHVAYAIWVRENCDLPNSTLRVLDEVIEDEQEEFSSVDWFGFYQTDSF